APRYCDVYASPGRLGFIGFFRWRRAVARRRGDQTLRERNVDVAPLQRIRASRLEPVVGARGVRGP
ncbi:MAG: hypothetical protein AAGM22_27540, partial [Acidobacteriota bacterium]